MNYNIHLSLNKNKNLFIASISNEKGELVKELSEEVSIFGLKIHEAFIRKKCIYWVKFESDEIINKETGTNT
jgi:hypothetical protein